MGRATSAMRRSRPAPPARWRWRARRRPARSAAARDACRSAYGATPVCRTAVLHCRRDLVHQRVVHRARRDVGDAMRALLEQADLGRRRPPADGEARAVAIAEWRPLDRRRRPQARPRRTARRAWRAPGIRCRARRNAGNPGTGDDAGSDGGSASDRMADGACRGHPPRVNAGCALRRRRDRYRARNAGIRHHRDESDACPSRARRRRRGGGPPDDARRLNVLERQVERALASRRRRRARAAFGRRRARRPGGQRGSSCGARSGATRAPPWRCSSSRWTSSPSTGGGRGDRSRAAAAARPGDGGREPRAHGGAVRRPHRGPRARRRQRPVRGRSDR